jgi:hypothetical protein
MYALYASAYSFTVAYGNTDEVKYMSSETEATDVSDTSIRVSYNLADELHDRKDRGDSYEDVIWELIEEVEDSAE